MKKTLGLVLALVMILTAVSAFAAIPSKTTDDLVTVTTENPNVTVVASENDSEAVTTLLTALMENNAIPTAAAAVLPEGNTYTKVEEVATLKIIGGTAEEDLTVNLKFPTDFSGKKVAVILGVLDNGVIAGAALDVYASEPLANDRIRNNAKISMTPHIGGSTKEAQDRIGMEIVDIIENQFK